MYIFLIISITYGSFGLISASTIDVDLAEISKLSQEFKDLSPDIVRRLTETICQMVSKCCPQIQSTFISMTLSGDIQGLVDECFDGKNSSNFLINILSCSPLSQILSMTKNPKLTKYMSIITNNSANDVEDMKLIFDTCSNDEIYSNACDWNRTNLQDKCQRKVFQKLSENSDKVYTDKIKQIKEGYIKLIDELKKEFNN